jgi:hypothetical protein
MNVRPPLRWTDTPWAYAAALIVVVCGMTIGLCL